jgi:hypothetical protein
MPHPNPKQDEVIYRLVLLSRHTHLVLGRADEAGMKLPTIGISKWTRAAAELQTRVKESWGVVIFVLDFLTTTENNGPCVVAQILAITDKSALTFARLEEIPLSDSERAAIVAIINGCKTGSSYLVQLGWVEEAIQWIGRETDYDFQFGGDITQYSAGSGFALVRFGNRNGKAYWLKATGEPNSSEFQITTLLASICSEYLPKVVAMRADWNAWLMEEAGDPLGTGVSTRTFERIIVTMANLQKSTLGYARRLVLAGATDHQSGVLLEHMEEIFDYLERAMTLQKSAKVASLTPYRLREIKAAAIEACESVQTLDIPDAVVHNDINNGNILISDETCVFTDWCEACVGSPFITLEHLLSIFGRNGILEEGDRLELKQMYGRSWEGILSPRQIERALAMSPLHALVSYFYGRGHWLQSEYRHRPHVQSYARSIARHMDRAAQKSLRRGFLCR